jgi:hypothetical protein
LQVAHFSLSFAHFAFAAFHCFCVHLETLSAVVLADWVSDWAAEGVGAQTVPTATAPAISTDTNAFRIDDMIQSP